MEQYRHRAKRDVLVSEHYATFGEMRRTVSEYLRTSGPKLDITKYIGRDFLVLRLLVHTTSASFGDPITRIC